MHDIQHYWKYQIQKDEVNNQRRGSWNYPDLGLAKQNTFSGTCVPLCPCLCLQYVHTLVGIHSVSTCACCLFYSSATAIVSACDCLRWVPSEGTVFGPAPSQAGSSQSGANVQEQDRASLTDGELTWKTCPLFRVQQSADDRYYFITQRLKRGWWWVTHSLTHSFTICLNH